MSNNNYLSYFSPVSLKDSTRYTFYTFVLRKENLNCSDDQLFHQYQQNEQPTTYHLE
jgi:hypothetical protein